MRRELPFEAKRPEFGSKEKENVPRDVLRRIWDEAVRRKGLRQLTPCCDPRGSGRDRHPVSSIATFLPSHRLQACFHNIKHITMQSPYFFSFNASILLILLAWMQFQEGGAGGLLPVITERSKHCRTGADRKEEWALLTVDRAIQWCWQTSFLIFS